MAQSDRMLLYLKKLVLISIFTFFCLLCVLTGYLLSVVIGFKQQVKTLQEQSAQVMTELTRVEKNIAPLLDPDLLSNLLAQGLEQLPISNGAASREQSVAQREISYLLESIGQPGLSYEYEGKQRTAPWVQTKLRLKTALMKIPSLPRKILLTTSRRQHTKVPSITS